MERELEVSNLFRPHLSSTLFANSFSLLASGPGPAGVPMEQQDFGFMSTFGTGSGADAVTSGLEVIWAKQPTNWTNGKFLLSIHDF